MNMKIQQNSFTIFAHAIEGTTGVGDELTEYLFKEKAQKIVLIKFPFFFSTKKAIKVYIITQHKKLSRESIIKFYKPEIVSYIKDFLYALYYGVFFCRNTELLICTNNLLATAGIFLKKMGFVHKVVYYMIDYTPKRYSNFVLNKIYIALDNFACENVDIVWSLNRQMLQARFDNNGLSSERVTYAIVPIGNTSHLHKITDYENFEQNKIVYFGGILKSKGAELFVPIAQSLLSRGISQFTFILIGGGDVAYLRQKVKRNKLEKYFKIYGPIDNQRKIESMLFHYGVAIAPYFPEDKNNFSYYADPGKVKVYLGCGLPIIITDVPPIAKDIVRKKAGLIAGYNADAFANAITHIIKSKRIYREFKNNAVKFGKDFSWDAIYKKALDCIL